MANTIERKSNGLTRRINILADKALLAAFSEGGHNIDNKHISLAAKDSDFGQERNWQPVIKLAFATAIIVSSIWIGTLLPGLSSTSSNVKPVASPISEPVTPAKPLYGSDQKTPDIENESAKLTHVVRTTENISIEQRLQQTQQWLKTAADNSFTIQLILLDQWAKGEVENYLHQASQLLDGNRLFIYQASIRGRMVYSVLYNEYAERKLATEQLKILPIWIKQNGPYLRTLKGIKADIRKTRVQNTIQNTHEAQL